MSNTVEPITDEERKDRWAQHSAILVKRLRETVAGGVSPRQIGLDFAEALNIYESTLSAAEEENAKLREALMNLNKALDTFWNDDTQSFSSIAERHCLSITEAQIACCNALSKGKDDG